MFKNTNGNIRISNLSINLARDGFVANEEVSSLLKDTSKERVRLLGKDLFMFAEGTLGLTQSIATDMKPDLSIAAGIYNYAQAITHRLMTTRGTHPADRFFGVPWDRYIGKTYSSGETIRSSLVQEITDELFKEPRTQNVVYVTANFQTKNVLEISCAVVPVGVTTDIEISLNVGDR